MNAEAKVALSRTLQALAEKYTRESGIRHTVRVIDGEMRVVSIRYEGKTEVVGKIAA